MATPKSSPGENGHTLHAIQKRRNATKTMEERQERWTERIKTCFQTTPGKEELDILYITGEMWEQIIPRLTEHEEAHSHIIPQQLQQIRTLFTNGRSNTKETRNRHMDHQAI